MTTWTMQQVAQARRLRASLIVDDELLARGEEAQRFAEDEMAKALTRMAHSLAIEMHREDFEVVWERNNVTPWQVTGRMRWHPSTNVAELRGGHVDGQRFAIRNIGEPLRVPKPVTTPWFLSENATPADAAALEVADTYELVGWREDERVWVYEIAQ